MLVPHDASAYDVFSYRYNYSTQSDSHEGEERTSTSMEPTQATVRVNNTTATNQANSENFKSGSAGLVPKHSVKLNRR